MSKDRVRHLRKFALPALLVIGLVLCDFRRSVVDAQEPAGRIISVTPVEIYVKPDVATIARSGNQRVYCPGSPAA